MEFPEREAMARAIVDGNSYMTLGTADAYGLPWASPVSAGEVERGMAVFSARSVAQGGLEWTAGDVGLSARLRLFRALASEQFVLSPQDERLPFSLE